MGFSRQEYWSGVPLPFLCMYSAAAAKSLQSCPTLRPHRWQPTRLPPPWDSPGKNTGVDCHFLLQCMKVKSDSEVVQSCLTLSDPMECRPTRLLHPWAFPGKNIGVGCHFLLPEETKLEKDTCIPLFIATLFTIARTWKQPRCPLTDEWIRDSLPGSLRRWLFSVSYCRLSHQH